MSNSESEQGSPWFSGRPGTILFYRINRRPLDNPSLDARQPDSVMDHMAESLLFGEWVATGRKNQRQWILGNREIRLDENLLMGQIGWKGDRSEAQGDYDPETKEWVDVVRDRDVSARSAFCFESRSRILGVLKHPSFHEGTIPDVFEKLLNKGEHFRDWPSTDWGVDPILDERNFVQWLHDVDSVQKVTMVAKLPNPDGLEEFQGLWDDLETMKARKIEQSVEAASETEGLSQLERNPRLSQHIAMSENGYGFVRANGYKNGRRAYYDQRNHVQRANTEELPSLWDDLMGVLKSQVAARSEKFFRDGINSRNG